MNGRYMDDRLVLGTLVSIGYLGVSSAGVDLTDMQREEKSRPVALPLRPHSDCTSVHVDNLLAYPETQTCPTTRLLGLRVELNDLVEEPLLVLSGNADAVVSHLNVQFMLADVNSNLHQTINQSKLYRIRQEISKDLRYLRRKGESTWNQMSISSYLGLINVHFVSAGNQLTRHFQLHVLHPCH